MPKFNIAVTHIETKFIEVETETWREAVEIASEQAEEEGLSTTGSVAVYDSDMKPIDTWST